MTVFSLLIVDLLESAAQGPLREALVEIYPRGVSSSKRGERLEAEEARGALAGGVDGRRSPKPWPPSTGS